MLEQQTATSEVLKRHLQFAGRLAAGVRRHAGKRDRACATPSRRHVTRVVGDDGSTWPPLHGDGSADGIKAARGSFPSPRRHPEFTAGS